MQHETFGLVKTLMDAHTKGVFAGAELLKECGYRVVVASKEIEEAMEKISAEEYQDKLIDWIVKNRITRLGFSYRLDPDVAVELMGRLVTLLKAKGLFESDSAQVKSIYFAGLVHACNCISQEYRGKIAVLYGGESAEDTLKIIGIPEEQIPRTIREGCEYDKALFKFGEQVIRRAQYKDAKPLQPNYYDEYGTMRDSLVKRIDMNFQGGFQPLIRAHCGPFSKELTRDECLKQFYLWCKELANGRYLDILSIGSSQLSQSNFGENWAGKANGGGVPVNSEEEYRKIWENAQPMLVRTYSATKNVCSMAEMYERTINISWHALSLWWFNELDGRGPNSLYWNLEEHINTIKAIAEMGKPLEANVSHHFAFRGCDDVTYIVSAYLAAKLAKKCGISVFILQNMLNTPRITWGIQDLAKSRALIRLIGSLKDESFRVVLQTRAGLDYFKPDLEIAKIQLAAVTAMMDDIEPQNTYSPGIIHVVSYSEALFLATPDIIQDSIKITRTALGEYRRLKKQKMTPDVSTADICSREDCLFNEARRIINAMETNIPDLYSPKGFYLAFTAGWLPVPELWSSNPEYNYAKNWETKIHRGGVHLSNKGILMSVDERINRAVSKLPDANYIIKSKYGK